MSSMLASTLRRAVTQPKPAALGAITTNIRRNCVTDAPKPQGKGLKEAWLSDKGAWPVIGVIGFAIVFSSAFLLRTTFTHPDVRIDRKSRCSVVREKNEK